MCDMIGQSISWRFWCNSLQDMLYLLQKTVELKLDLLNMCVWFIECVNEKLILFLRISNQSDCFDKKQQQKIRCRIQWTAYHSSGLWNGNFHGRSSLIFSFLSNTYSAFYCVVIQSQKPVYGLQLLVPLTRWSNNVDFILTMRPSRPLMAFKQMPLSSKKPKKRGWKST